MRAFKRPPRLVYRVDGRKVSRRVFERLTGYKGVYAQWLIGWMLISELPFILDDGRGSRITVSLRAEREE